MRWATCVNHTTHEEGYCMLAADCSRSGGRHVAACLRGVVFGSCCAFNGGSPADPQAAEVASAAMSAAADRIKPGQLPQLPRVPGLLSANHLSPDLRLWWTDFLYFINRSLPVQQPPLQQPLTGKSHSFLGQKY